MKNIPSNSNISAYATDAYFSDCFTTEFFYDNQSALEIFIEIARAAPKWVNISMTMRNKTVSKLGLKNLGTLSDIDKDKAAIDYKVGERVGIFTLYSNSHKEAILEDRDHHLNVKVSVYIEPNGDKAQVHVSTVVHVNNMLGKIYMLFVTPMHKLIVPTTLKALPQA